MKSKGIDMQAANTQNYNRRTNTASSSSSKSPNNHQGSPHTIQQPLSRSHGRKPFLDGTSLPVQRTPPVIPVFISIIIHSYI
jgi:hypothetical protein